MKQLYAFALALILSINAVFAQNVNNGGVGAYNALPPLLNSGQPSNFQLDPYGNLKIVSQGGAIGIGDGGDATLGSKADTASCAAGNSALSCFRQLHSDLINTLSIAVTGASNTGITPVSSTALTSSQVIKSGPGNLYSINVITGGTAGYIMLFDATTAPSDGAVTPKWATVLPANAAFSGSPSGTNIGMLFSTGIVVVFSSTGPFTKTASATAFIAGSAR